MADPPVIVVEDDPFTRLIPLVLDPNASEERRAAFADFMSTDEPDFAGWCARVRKGSRGALSGRGADGDVRRRDAREPARTASRWWSKSFRVGRDDLAAAPQAQGGAEIRHRACATSTPPPAPTKGVKLLTLRRRANISCAEHAFGLMLMLARKLDELDGLVTVERIEAARGAYRPFDRQHTPGGNYARVGGTRALNGATIGIIGLGEIGREIAIRAPRPSACTCSITSARARPRAEERELNARHVPLPTLLAESDWIVPQLPTLPSTRDLLGRAELAQIKPGACIVNVANAADHQPRGADRGACAPDGSAAWRSTCTIRSRCRTTTSCCRSTT